MTLEYLSDEMANSLEHKEQLHRQALAKYTAWQETRVRRSIEYAAMVDAYHARLDRAGAQALANDRLDRVSFQACPQAAE